MSSLFRVCHGLVAGPARSVRHWWGDGAGARGRGQQPVRDAHVAVGVLRRSGRTSWSWPCGGRSRFSRPCTPEAKDIRADPTSPYVDEARRSVALGLLQRLSAPNGSRRTPRRPTSRSATPTWPPSTRSCPPAASAPLRRRPPPDLDLTNAATAASADRVEQSIAVPGPSRCAAAAGGQPGPGA